ncbi:MAG TPA: hypothetical protein VGJ17_00750 [Candidatus Limnocylindrales bacterium]
MTSEPSPTTSTGRIEPTESFQPVPPEPGPYEVPAQSVAAAPQPRARRGPASWINVLLGLAFAVAIGGVAFAAGRMTAPAAAAANGLGSGTGNGGRVFGNGEFPGNFGGGNGGNGGAGGIGRGGGGASIQGTVTAISADSITIKTASGQDVTFSLTPTTTYHQQSTATAGDVKTGGNVLVRIGFNPGTGETQTAPSVTDVTVVPQ